MSAWWARTSGYRLGVLVLFLGSAFYLIGYVSPFWWHGEVEARLGRTTIFQYRSRTFGIWLACSSEYARCVSQNTYFGIESWFKAVQALTTLGVIGLFAAFVTILVVNCSNLSGHNPLPEILSIIGGLCSFTGCMVFVGKVPEDFSYGWAFGLSLSGSILVIISSIIIFLHNRTSFLKDRPRMYGGARGMPVQGGYPGAQQHGGPLLHTLPGPAQPGYVIQPESDTAQCPAGDAPVAAPPQAGYAPVTSVISPPQAGPAPVTPVVSPPQEGNTSIVVPL